MELVRDEIDGLIAALPLAALVIGRDERIHAVNDQARALLGEHLVGRHFITALRQPAVMDAIEDCLASQVPQVGRYLGNDGAQDTTYRVQAAWVEFAGKAGVLVSFEDVTPMERAGQMRRDFVANVSHELRTPLTAMMGFIETLQGPARGDTAASDRFLATMYSEANRMERLVRDLLALSRVESEERVRPNQTVDLAGLVRSVAHTLRPLLENSEVTLDLELPQSDTELPGDADQLRQVVTNLIENAVKYGGKGKTVTVTLSHAENDPMLRRDALLLSVRDEGPGISEIHIPRLTERFYRVDSHRSREMGGTGLGLAIVKHIVSRHRGRLRIESELGQGSVFRVILPR
ncbi:sensor histidine kinase [Roseovarius nubinhibens]|uniref:histidine kinase n=1 Tax=Roseovarius nubinhibens (strain ATCC BAA-591 / DSM 15170 / ISM) TaxID=89187 RepID=A3SPB1_ROSNI|nr:ATP-binding protein [Roseovarius nubinhibens]EAP76301.1 phosphate regulon sensor histidine kinase, putative [Roseovarius nubinhibens ISM]